MSRNNSIIEINILPSLRAVLCNILVIPLLLIACSKDNNPPDENSGTGNIPGGGSEVESELPKGKVLFDVSPIDLSGVVFFEPMGSMGTFPKDHGGFHHKQVGVASPNIRLYALADGFINAVGKDIEDYWIQIRYSTTISVKLGHVGRLDDAVLAQTGQFSNNEVKNVAIKVTKGQVIGFVSSLGAVDMGLHDQESQKSFCYPDLWWFETLYASDIFDYFTEPTKAELLQTAIRQVAPFGGKVDYDVKGTIAGNWFLSGGAADSFGNHFAIGYDYLHPHRVIIYNGYAEFVENDTTFNHAWIKDNTPLPESIDQAFGIVKYELIGKRGWIRDNDDNFSLDPLLDVDEQMTIGIALFKMLDDETMQVEYFKGQGLDDVDDFSGNQRIYVRKP